MTFAIPKSRIFAVNAPFGSRARNDVLRLEIAMHDALRVRRAEAREDALAGSMPACAIGTRPPERV